MNGHNPDDAQGTVRFFYASLGSVCVFALLPFGEGAFVHTKDFLAFNRWHLQVKPPLFNVLADMPGMGWIELRFP